MSKKVALITGGNTGIGLALAERLLHDHENLELCLACRNVTKAEAAKATLLETHPNATVSLVQMDVSNVQSVINSAQHLRTMYRHVDYLYLNAGIMPVTNVNWGHFWKCLFSKKCIHMFRTGDGLLRQDDKTTDDGLKQIFATNLFGHFLLVRELEYIMGGDKSSQIIWTSSLNAKKTAFSLTDVQHINGNDPYSSSKYAIDMMSVALNEKLNNKNIYSHTTCPGLVMTNLTFGILPTWFWTLVFPLLWMLRLFTPSLNVTPQNGAEALSWLSKQEPERLDPQVKFLSHVSIMGARYTSTARLHFRTDDTIELYNTLLDLQTHITALLH